MSIAETALLDALIREIPGMGVKFTGTATQSGQTVTTTSALINRGGSNKPPTEYQGRYLVIPAETGGDQVHSIKTVAVNEATGVTTITTLDTYDSTTTDGTMYILFEHPDTLRGLYNDALDDIQVECEIILRHGPDDADMQTTAATSWTGTNVDTLAKQTTATEVLFGQRSLPITLTSAGGYATSTTVRAGQGETVTGYALAKADTGTGIFRLIDNAGNTLESVSFTQEQWILIKKTATLASDDEGVAIRILGTDNNDQIDVQAAWVINHSENNFDLSDWIDDRFRLKAVSRAIYGQSGREPDTSLARSRTLERLSEGEHYRYINRMADATPVGIEFFTDDYRHYPIFLTVDCPWSAPYGISAEFTSFTSTTDCPERLLVPKCMQLIGERYEAAFPGMAAKGAALYVARLLPRVTEKAKLPEWHGPLGGRGRL